ncbi:MAG: outer membrane protein transport protein [Mariprofundaceae bacterium]
MKRIGMILCCMLATSAQAGGFANQNYSASSLGAGNAVVAGADDVSAAAYNAAGIAWQDGFQIMAGLDVRSRNSSVKQGAVVAPNKGGARGLQNVYMAWMPHDGSLGFSLSYNTPFEVENKWGARETKIRSDRLSVDGIYAVSSNMAVSLGADWYRTSATLTQGTGRLEGKDSASFGAHLGLKWKFSPQWMLGASLRKGADISLSGSGNTSAKLKLPDEFIVGVAHDIADAIRVEVDASWMRWSRMKDMNVKTGNVVTQANALDLKDTLSLMSGLTWYWRENSQLRFGYAYDQGANSSSGFNSMIADQNGHRISLGMGGDMFGVHADLAYAYTFHSKNTVTGSFAGDYRDRRQSLALSISKGF